MNEANTVAVSRWRARRPRSTATTSWWRACSTKNGSEVWRGERTVHFGGGPVRAEIDKAASKLIADGRTRPVIALRMFDKYGKPARAGTIATFSVDSPYRSWWEVEQLDDNQILSTGSREPQVEVREGGLALIELEPTTTTGNAMLRLRFNERQSDEYQGVAGAGRARLDPGRHRRRHGGVQHHLRQHGNRQRRRSRRGLRSRTAAWRSSPRAASRATSC